MNARRFGNEPHRDVRIPADESEKYERLTELANAILRFAAATKLAPHEARDLVLQAAKQVKDTRLVDAKPAAMKLAHALRITAMEARDLILRARFSDADGEALTMAMGRQLEVDGPKLASLFALQGLCTLSEAQSAVLTMREQHRAGTVTMSGQRLLDTDPAAWAREVSARTGAPLSECQAEATRLRANAAPHTQAGAGAAAVIAARRQEDINAASREAGELTRQGWTLESAQAEVLRRRAAAPPPAPPPPPPPPPPAPPPRATWPTPQPTPAELARAHQAMRDLQEVERRHKLRGR